jgi:transcriptional regulator with XRE-family HTH domain
VAKQGLGDRIRRAREHRVLTQEELAAELGISTRSLQHYESGRGTPRPARRRQLLAWLETEEAQVAA